MSIAVIDDAVDVGHPDVWPSVVLPAPGELRDLVDMDADPSPQLVAEGHGTRTTGLAVAKGGNAIGVAGVCPECKVLPFRSLENGIAAQALAFIEAGEQGASIISCSWSYVRDFAYDNLETTIVEAAVAGRGGRGIVVVFGTLDGDVALTISGLEDVVAVGQSTEADQVAPVAASGSELDLLAPAVRMVTTAPRPGTPAGGNPGPEPGYDLEFSGSSAAAPVVAGVAGLVLSVNPNLLARDVREILIATADKIAPEFAAYDASGFSLTYGYGRVNAYRAVKAALCWQETANQPFARASLASLWLAILLSAAGVCIVSVVIWRFLRYHDSDYVTLPGAAAVEAAIAGAPRGEYRTSVPLAYIRVLPAGLPAIWWRMLGWFLFCLVVGLFIAYVSSRTLSPGAAYLAVFRIAGTVGWLAYGAAIVPDWTWTGRSWKIVLKLVFDALMYGLVTAGVFGWLWPD